MARGGGAGVFFAVGVDGSNVVFVDSDSDSDSGTGGGVSGKVAGGGAGVAEGDLDNENLPTLLDMKLPIPAPQVLKRAGVDGPDELSEVPEVADATEVVDSMLVCFLRRVGLIELLVEEESKLETEPSKSVLFTISSSSDMLTVLVSPGLAVAGVAGTAVDGVLGGRCQRSLTPSTALKKVIEPALKVRDTASRAGASCCSSLRS